MPSGEVVVLSPERSISGKRPHAHPWSSAIGANSERAAERFFPHWYDLVMLAKHRCGQSAIRKTRELFEEFVRHKKVFFHH